MGYRIKYYLPSSLLFDLYHTVAMSDGFYRFHSVGEAVL